MLPAQLLALLALPSALTPAVPALSQGIAGQETAVPPAATADDERTLTTGEARVDALAVYARYRQLAAEPLWPGFDPLAIPLTIVDDERTLLFGHPDPPPGFDPVDAFPEVHWFGGAHPDIHAAGSATLGGVPTAALALEANEVSPVAPAASLVREAFLLHQAAVHPEWRADDAAHFDYPTENSVILEQRRFEVAALRRAEGALVPEEARGWAMRALRYRSDRHLQLSRSAREYEREIERQNGLARYLHDRCLEGADVRMPEGGFGPGDIHQRCSATGAALARLLDRFGKGWRETFAQSQDGHLADTLAEVLGEPEPGSPPPDFGSSERETLSNTAVLDALRYRMSLDEQRRAFQEKDGWSVEIQTPAQMPLFAVDVDPQGLRRFGPFELLHERRVELVNLDGKVEVRGLAAMTYGAGEHALYQGVARILVTGIPEEPRVVVADGGVTCEGLGLRVEFEDASARLVGQRWRIELGRE